jgi:hypothetical protein
VGRREKKIGERPFAGSYPVGEIDFFMHGAKVAVFTNFSIEG